MPETTVLAALLINPETQQVIAWDDGAREVLNLAGDQSCSTRLEELFPAVRQSTWTEFLSQQDAALQSLSTTISDPHGGKREVVLHLAKLSGADSQYRLISVLRPSDTEAFARHRDALTGLPDRRELADRYWQHLSQTKDSPKSVALLFLDLEHFKQVNDHYGHIVGDQVLVTLSNRWSDCLRDTDIVARYGGDEFIVLLLDLRKDEAHSVAKRLNCVTSKAIQVGELCLNVNATIGLAYDESGSVPLEELITLADRRMYQLKGNLNLEDRCAPPHRD